ncbi:MAG TPA: bifunctional diaminohydroxyphosphoribosylaminopyrimidine deaminase/5-amino-6-(5-phosphoribosylamino)uracil reductase RibD [Accumulibacter sp.]|jgi:diaminohydroxyphosphoribosylaminopyrimidine deaminase/5-amino-6-(5-phosphoribosylamino)uracil reductase|nr:bifunctional diaminohydroxyphosphoribosylaminopyrimidine deaminase/5-amino-6-(5-phosphoribosylamino)uracil reductase RibD [Accumulibacter sp.]HQC79017.1 bifunctional diaminohydroxyphosphoribosylaminopyrimidine deaminase/5-amino-6-(5-phosphoribosylamino)uracil reductase RibD [Accumulibacter sp.]
MTSRVFSAADHGFMARALRLAESGLYTTTPNPRVGCVLVHGGQVVGEGWHRRAGEAHAEVNALRAAGDKARGATAYVTLEPCSHHGRTPPCADALLAAGVARVVAAMRDPNPLVAGQGLARLRDANIRSECGLLEDAARELNLGFVARMTRNRPWLRLKLAASLDGKTALHNGHSQWLTGPAARRDGHRWRARACAILTGIGTVRHDDPQLNVRDLDPRQRASDVRQPLKVIVDSRLELSADARLLREGRVLVATTARGHARSRIADLTGRGAEILQLPDVDGRVDLSALLRVLAERGINEIHAEAGHGLSGTLLARGLVDELLLYLAPCLIGDKARGMFDLPALESLAGKRVLSIRDLRSLGNDLRVVARFN